MTLRKSIIAIRRDERFSPNSVEKDKAILQAVIHEVGGDVAVYDEHRLTGTEEADLYLSMARLPHVIQWLKAQEERGARVINSGWGVENCMRSRIERLMKDLEIPVPPAQGQHGYWVKRGDAAAQSADDVVFCKDTAAVEIAKRRFKERGVDDVTVSSHVVGDLVKFYGVADTFFKCYYPTDDSNWKFADERHNGMAHHYGFEMEALHKDVCRLANAARVEVFGGDCIVDKDGRYFLIDFNDWPSFSRCRSEAAAAIAQLVM